MSEPPVETADPPRSDPPRLHSIANHFQTIGLVCSVMALYLQVQSAGFVFGWLPKFVDIYKSVKVKILPQYSFIYDYGVWLWVAVLTCIVLSFLQVLRKGRKGTSLAVAVVTLAAAFALEWICREAAWGPMKMLFQGIGTHE